MTVTFGAPAIEDTDASHRSEAKLPLVLRQEERDALSIGRAWHQF